MVSIMAIGLLGIILSIVFFCNDRENVNLKDPGTEIIESADSTKQAGDNAISDVTQKAKTFIVQSEVIPQKKINWDELKKENEDVYAWLYVPDVDIDYPILQHPTDDTYYLKHNLNGSVGYPGCIMTEHYNSKDFEDKITVLYGHNLNSGEAFTRLHEFEEPDRFEGEHYIFIYTEGECRAYKIFAAREYSAVHILANYDYSKPGVFDNFLYSLYNSECRVGRIRSDLDIKEGDRLIVLSTCTADDKENLRYLVVGVLVETVSIGSKR